MQTWGTWTERWRTTRAHDSWRRSGRCATSRSSTFSGEPLLFSGSHALSALLLVKWSPNVEFPESAERAPKTIRPYGLLGIGIRFTGALEGSIRTSMVPVTKPPGLRSLREACEFERRMNVDIGVRTTLGSEGFVPNKSNSGTE